MKKVAIVYSGAKYQGGVETYLENLFEFYDRKKVELVLISLGDWLLCKKIEALNCQVIVIASGRIHPQTFFDIQNIIKEEGINLLVSQGVVANFYARIGTRLARVPHLTTVHSDLRAEYPNPLINAAYRLSDYLVRPFTCRYIAASNYLKERLIARGIKADKIDVIYNGVAINKTTKQQNNKATERQNDKRTGEVIIGSMGRLDKVKGYDNLIKAFSMLGPTDAKLIIWGEGKERVKLEKLIEELDLKEKVDLPGFIDAGAVLSQTDIYVQSSISEGLGLSVIEAMLAGKPVVVTPVGGMKEIVKNGKTGFVSKSIEPKDLADAIKKVFDEPKAVGEMVEKARLEAKERFSVEQCVKSTVEVYLETAA